MRHAPAALVLLFAPSVAVATPSLAVHVEGAAALPVGSDKSAQFGLGGDGTVSPELKLNDVIGVEVSLGALALSDGGAKTPPGVVPTGWGFAAYSTLGPRLRPLAPLAHTSGAFGPDGLWLAGGAGAGVTGGQIRPTVSASLGYDVQASAVAAGPFVGFFQMIETSEGVRPGDARVLMFGLHGSLSTARRPTPSLRPSTPRPPVEEPRPLQPPAPPTPTPCGAGENGQPPDPKCPDTPKEIEVVGDDLVLDDRIHFETGIAVVSRTSFPLLQHLAAFLGAHAEYSVIHVEGHTDDTGPLPFNDRLSRARADAVRAVLVGFGVAPNRLTIDGFGPRKPRAPGVSDDARRQNRRVEFEIVERTALEPDAPVDGAL